MSRKKMILTAVLVVVLVVLALLRTGGVKYVNKYAAVGFVHSNTSSSAYMSFYTFDGTMVFKLKNKDSAGKLHASGTVESGNLKVYWDHGQGKELAMNLQKPKALWEWTAEDFETGTIYIIVETDGKCENGELHFDLE